MERYYFHVQDGRFEADLTGTLLATKRDARRHAIDLASSLLHAENEGDWNETEWQITVTDADDTPLFALNFAGECLGSDTDRAV